MASPFYLFRKYQRAFIAIAAVVAMFIFVVADPLMSWLQSGSGPQRNAKEVLASWDGGEITAMELDRLTQRRYKINQFLGVMFERARQQIEQEGGTAEPPSNLPDLRLRTDNYQAIQQGCVYTRVFADLARESGISVSDKFINHYLKKWGLGKTGDAEIAGLLSQINLSDKALFSGLRELLMTNFYTNSLVFSTAGSLPEERWEDWKKLNERIVLQATVLPTEKFLSEVPEPSDAALKQFYEEFKDRIPGLSDREMGTYLPSPDPGFREPRKVKLQYLVGNLDDWTEKSKDSITDEAIAEYYEANKATMFVKTSASASTSIDGLFDDEPEEEDSTEAAASEEAETAAESEESEETSAEEANETAAEAATESAGEAPAEQPSDQDSGQVAGESPFRLAAFQTESDDSEAAEATAEPSDEASETESADDAEEQTPDSEPVESDTAEDSTEYEPLENVKDQIRRTLAEEKGFEALQKVFRETSAKLEAAYNPYGADVVSARIEEKEIPEPPAKLADYKAIAAETGLTSEETVLLSQQELSETFVGKAAGDQTGSRRVFQLMFSEDIEPYDPIQAIDMAGNAYIVCKTEDVPSRVPDFEEVKEDVLAAWKKSEAAKLALSKAEELAKSAQESGDTLAAIAGDQEVVTTDAFSWRTLGTNQTGNQPFPRLGEAPPLKSVGEEFMEKAFSLTPDEKLAVMNHDRSAAYVIRLDRRDLTEEEMKNQFLSDSVNGWYGGQMMEFVRREVSRRQYQTKLGEQIGLDIEPLLEAFSGSVN